MYKRILSMLSAIACISISLFSCRKDTFSPDTSTQKDAFTNVIYETVQNPILNEGADPWVTEHDGRYYYCYSTGNGVAVKEAPSIHQLDKANGGTVYTAPEGTNYSAEYWAPELHYIDGSWYIYVAADDGNNINHRMYVLKREEDSPVGDFKMVGQITDTTNKWAIDGTVLEHNGELYFIWSGWEGDVNVAQNIYIAHMSDPCTIDSTRVLLSSPSYDWEKIGNPDVNEGPVILKNGSNVFLIYSASGSWTDDYCLGMLTLDGNDPMNPEHWKKSSEPVFKKDPQTAFGPGHCSFAPARDGSIWMVYHANPISGTGWQGRTIWLASVTFGEDGVPILGSPQKEVSFPVAVE